MNQDLLTCPFFRFLPDLEEITFKGTAADGIFLYEARQAGEPVTLLTAPVLVRDEKFVWESFRELIGRSIEEAQALVRGVYKVDLLSFDIQGEIRTFNDRELARLITNHARKLHVGEERLVKYSSCFWLIKKLVIEDWGRITLNCSLLDMAQPPEKMDLLVSRLLRLAEKIENTVTISVMDHSRGVILDDNNDEQKRRLRKALDKTDSLFSPRRAVYWTDHTRCEELNRYVSR